MINTFYTIPLTPATLLVGDKHPKTSLERSIEDFLELIVLTTSGEYRRDESFGCQIWEKEFEILPLEPKWQTEIKKSIADSVQAHETRLENVDVDVKTVETSFLMKKLDITISGKIKQTGKPFEYSKTIYLCPKAIDQD